MSTRAPDHTVTSVTMDERHYTQHYTATTYAAGAGSPKRLICQGVMVATDDNRLNFTPSHPITFRRPVDGATLDASKLLGWVPTGG